MIKTIFLDFDGVIVDSVDIKTDAFVKLFESKGKEIAEKVKHYHLQNTGVSRYDKFRAIYREILNHGLSENMFNKLCDEFSALVIDGVINAPYIKGAKEFLENYASRYTYFVISATPQGELEEIIRRRNIGKLFKAIYGAPIKKEDAVRGVLTKEKIKPYEAVYIGDAMSDYTAAKDNSINFIAIIKDNKSILSDLDCIRVKDFTELEKFLQAL